MSLDYTRLQGSLSYTVRPCPKKVNSNKAIKELNPKNGQGAWPEPLEADSTSRGGGHAPASLALNGATPWKHNELRYSDK